MHLKVFALAKFKTSILPSFFLQCSLVLLVYRNIDFGTKYPREDKNGEAKIRPFTGSQ